MREVARRTWLITLALAGIALAGTAFWGYTQYTEKQRMVTYLNNRNQKSFFEMVGHVENMEVLLSKTIASGSSNQKRMLLSDLWMQSTAAQEDLGILPMSQFQSNRTQKFLNQVGDYAYSLAKKYSSGGQVAPQETTRLQKLHTEAGALSTQLTKISSQALSGRLSWGEIANKKPGVKSASIASLSDGLRKVDKQMQEYPTLIYDGPFSDHIDKKAPRGLTGTPIDAVKARSIANSYLAGGNKPMFRIQRVGNVNGRIPSFRVYFQPAVKTGPAASVDVSKKGGHVVMMIVSRGSGKPVITERQARDKASRYLDARGLKGMVPTYSLIQSNTAVITYCYQQNGVLVYPDMIKVKVALDNGDIIGLDNTTYVMNHTNRKIPTTKISEAEARKAVSPNLTVTGSRLAIIPTETFSEKLTWEFKGNIKGDQFIVYIDAQTGQEQRVLKLIKTKDGQLTM